MPQVNDFSWISFYLIFLLFVLGVFASISTSFLLSFRNHGSLLYASDFMVLI